MRSVNLPANHVLETEQSPADASERRLLRLAVDCSAEGDFDELTDSQKIALLRVVHEGLANVRKHSGASSVSVVLREMPEATELTIRDDGRGFDVDRLGRDRLGLAGVTERV